ncbi:hypothetical protein [Tunturiibacter gelidoferens]|uniref:Uncharacterized protein n=1 Tax=Tunturiibacter lichenicola TaxID=2051959 RepID=A0A7Y9T1W3_9BACT|nr:hypothetical protein [Edaphobacter lichenicola]NYF50938.1 hypothetical protein [Edaphobacter lichenicola]
MGRLDWIGVLLRILWESVDLGWIRFHIGTAPDSGGAGGLEEFSLDV